MFLVERGVRQTMHLGVRFRGSRKGEFNCMLVQQLRGRTFRDFQVAAPLKLRYLDLRPNRSADSNVPLFDL